MPKRPASSFHVAPRGDRWSVRRSGAVRSTSLHETQQAAVEAARAIVKRDGGELYVHGRDGRIRERSTFGRDPHPPKG